MPTFGTFHDGVVVLDPGSGYVPEGTRVEVSLRTGMEPLIRKTPDVLGGEACIGRRRIAVWMLVEAKRLGATDESLLKNYDPPLSREDLNAAWAYTDANRDEIEKAIRENNED